MLLYLRLTVYLVDGGSDVALRAIACGLSVHETEIGEEEQEFPCGFFAGPLRYAPDLSI